MAGKRLALVALLACCALSGAAAEGSSRIREQAITLKANSTGRVLGLPIVDPPTRVAGYFKLNRTYAAEMFYFFFRARMNPEKAPVVLWMTGGPGCSSELAVLYENGPYTLNEKTRELVETEYGWDVTHNMIFVDQPIGTGFSYSDDDRDTVYGEKGVADDMLDFLQEFFVAHPELAGLPVYVTGESYAGHYVPAVSHRVWLSNKNKEGPYIHLRGLAVGNGLTDPAIQFGAYGDYALQNKLISDATRSFMGFLYPICGFANYLCDALDWSWVCEIGLNFCMATQFQPILAANPDINVYDITKKCDGRLCYDFTAADEFLNSPATRAALGVGKREWVACNPEVYQDMAGDWLHKFDDILPEMMSDGIRVMIYAGDLDLICNYVGNRRWVDALDWDGSADWDAATDREWGSGGMNGAPGGQVKAVGPLSFVRVYKAGHMVPMDQALNGLTMITAWTRNKSLPPASAASAQEGAGALASTNEASAQSRAAADALLRGLAEEGVEKQLEAPEGSVKTSSSSSKGQKAKGGSLTWNQKAAAALYATRLAGQMARAAKSPEGKGLGLHLQLQQQGQKQASARKMARA